MDRRREHVRAPAGSRELPRFASIGRALGRRQLLELDGRTPGVFGHDGTLPSTQGADDARPEGSDFIVFRCYRRSVPLSDAAYARLLALRTGLRHFERWSAQQARAAGLTPAHHQLLLAIRGHIAPEGPTIGEVADYLLLRHHSAVGLVDRAEAVGLVRRDRSEEDHRIVHLYLTEEGAARLEALSALHLEELDRLAPDLPAAWAGLAPVQRPHGFPGEPDESSAQRASVTVGIARVYERPRANSTRVLVDRLWPRGVPKADAPFTQWLKDVAPSAELRKWYGHRPERFDEFARRYRDELTRGPARDALASLCAAAHSAPVTLVTATKDLDRSGAAVLKDLLAGL
jgi:uncharacterized protein YeaO (DUF488 family)/DNA-binding MarR family transcriptional regulator